MHPNHIPLIKSLLKGSYPILNKRNHTFGKLNVECGYCVRPDDRVRATNAFINIVEFLFSEMKSSQSVLDVLVHCSLPRITQLLEKFWDLACYLSCVNPFGSRFFSFFYILLNPNILCILYVYLRLWLWKMLTVSVHVFKEVCLFKNRILATHQMHYFCSGTHWYSAHWYSDMDFFLKPNTHRETPSHIYN